MNYVVGIDLGTTHCVVAAASHTGGEVRIFDVPQLIASGEVIAKPLLPSFLYLCGDEMDAASLKLPWGSTDYVVGEWARHLGEQTPNRLVASAKSWICHGGVRRTTNILPWSAPDSEPHISPLEASRRCLLHVRNAWDHAHPTASLAKQHVVVTVPASFDDDARQLTLVAASQAGLVNIHLIEEPQAAFYDYLNSHTEVDARLVLVVDVGGGTTDLTLLCKDNNGAFERIAVGGHLMLGGDNMDAALAHYLHEQSNATAKLDPSSWSMLVQRARQAKETLLAKDAPDQMTVSLPQRGSRLVGGSSSVAVTRQQVEALLLDGFVPFTASDDVASRGGRSGFTTLGLPYVTDPALPKHIAAFLKKHAQASAKAGAPIHNGLPRPDAILFNGGVFKAAAISQRLLAVMQRWYGDAELVQLPATSLDTAVAVGAVRYGLARLGVGTLIGGGTARAYYLGVDAHGQKQALCVAPRGMQEGAELTVPNRTFQLLLNRRVSFSLYSSTADRADEIGAVQPLDDELVSLPDVEAVLRGQATSDATKVTVSATLTEQGGLALSLNTVLLPPQRWRLAFALQAEEPPATKQPDALPTTNLSAETKQAMRLLENAFASDEEAKRVRGQLENKLGPRGTWSVDVCRALGDVCLHNVDVRRKSAVRELHWLRLVSWCLRPGLGAPNDHARMQQLWQEHQYGLAFASRGQWPDWWVLWRRVAAGLTPQQQRVLFEQVVPNLAGESKVAPPAHGVSEMLQLLGALERLSPANKETAGAAFLRHASKLGSYWVLGRLGARQLLFGDSSGVIAASTAAQWLNTLATVDFADAKNGAAFAAALIARKTGDPSRDLPDELRQALVLRLRDAKAPATWIDMVAHTTTLSGSDANKVVGESLPVGLRLVAD